MQKTQQNKQEIYSYNTHSARKKEHIVMAYLNNKTGVLNKVVSLFRRRRFNILSLTTGPSEKPGMHRLTFTVDGETTNVNQVIHQMQKLIDVVYVEDVTSKKRVTHELALIKIRLPSAKKELEHFSNELKKSAARIIQQSNHKVIIELTGKPPFIEKFLKTAKEKSCQILEISRTGVTSMNE
jgi:acetolactate synthase I/III small subunit